MKFYYDDHSACKYLCSLSRWHVCAGGFASIYKYNKCAKNETNKSYFFSKIIYLCNLYLRIILSWLHSLFLNFLAAAFYAESASCLEACMSALWALQLFHTIQRHVY